MTSETETALEPCPFCGEAADKPWQVKTRHHNDGEWDIECSGCSAAIRKEHSRESVIKAWNTRAAPSSAPEAQDRLADEKQEVVAALYKAWPDAEDIPSDWPLGIIGCIEQIISERDEARSKLNGERR